MHKGSQVFSSTLSPWDIRVLGFQDVRKGCAFSSLLAWAQRVGCPEGGMRSWGCCSPPAGWMAVAKAEGQGGGDLELLSCSREKPFPVGILITCHLMACLSTPPPPQPRRTLVSPTDASWVPPPEILIPLVQDSAWQETVGKSPGGSNEQPGLRTITQTGSFLFPL